MEDKQHEWIPCCDVLPESSGEYLTTIRWRNRDNNYMYLECKRYYNAEIQTWNDSLVIAWKH